MSVRPARAHLTAAELSTALSLRDLTDPSAGPHAMQLLLDTITGTLTDLWQVPLRLVRDSPLVAIADNYDRLGYASDDVTRASRYTRYVSSSVMLRSHTTAAIPAALRALSHDGVDDQLIAVPGLVHRRDVVDRTHVGEPHQLDLWRVSQRWLSEADLDQLIGAVVDAVLPGAIWRTIPTSHPYTVAGRQVDVRVGDEWLELAECGLADRGVLTRAGLPVPGWNGLALGMGLDRAVMLRKGIDDIRLLRSRDPRALDQLGDLEPWRPISALPSISRDLSLVVGADEDEETLGDQVRATLGARVADLESVQLLARTGYHDLPERARVRLGIDPDQCNVLLRLTIRPLERTLTDAQANRLRDDVYLALHRGPVIELAAG